ncbi:MAG: YkvA family protein [Thermoanaerobaculia bacterium]
MDRREPTDDETVREAEVLLGDAMREGKPMEEGKAHRFYDRIRGSISSYLSRKGQKAGRAQDFLFFAPDVFILLFRLTQDSRVSGQNKVLLGTALAYYVFPIDIMPEALLGPIGFLDDLVFGVYVLNRMLADTDEQVLRDHWSGTGDVLDMIRRVLKSADGLVASDVVAAIKKLVR